MQRPSKQHVFTRFDRIAFHCCEIKRRTSWTHRWRCHQSSRASSGTVYRHQSRCKVPLAVLPSERVKCGIDRCTEWNLFRHKRWRKSESHVGLPSPSCVFLGRAVQRRSDHRDDHNPNAHVCDAPVSRQRARGCQSSGCGLKSKDPGGLQQQLNDKLQYLDILST